jgi:hypothetical protein
MSVYKTKTGAMKWWILFLAITVAQVAHHCLPAVARGGFPFHTLRLFWISRCYLPRHLRI